MQVLLTWAIRGFAGLTYVAAAAACVWALGIDYQPPPHTGVLVCVWTAAGSLIVRAVLLWVRRWHGIRTLPDWSKAVSLEKGKHRNRARTWDVLDATPDGPEGWIKFRQLAANVLLLSASMTAVTLINLPRNDSLPIRLQHAHPEVATATIAEPPRITGKDYDDDDRDRVVAYYSKVKVSVPGGPARLSVGPIRSSEPPRVGERLQVLWSPSSPSLGGYADSPDRLEHLAHAQWRANLTGGVSTAIAAVFGLVMLPWVFCFAFGLDDDLLNEIAWSPGTQSGYALILAGVAYGYTPALTGEASSGIQTPLLYGGWLLLGFMILAPIHRLLRGG
ncbi:hypothetical protein ABZ502_06070 [Streptomyces abikoensis]|uniref:hypothetical protein n=1 Tax=Streptomyces abikoensis TaxID=97398 RepID=UPI0033DE782F